MAAVATIAVSKTRGRESRESRTDRESRDADKWKRWLPQQHLKKKEVGVATKTNIWPTFEEGLEVNRIVTAAIDSSAKGAWVNVADY